MFFAQLVVINNMFNDDDETMQRGYKRKFVLDQCLSKKKRRLNCFQKFRNINSSRPMVLTDGKWKYITFYASG